MSGRRAAASARTLARLAAAAALAAARPTPARAQSPAWSAPAPGDPAAAPPELAIGVMAGVYGALYLYTYLAWYRGGEDSPSLRIRDEGWLGRDTYAGGADKLGHLWRATRSPGRATGSCSGAAWTHRGR